MMTYKQALNEFNNMRSDDDFFDLMWGCNDEQQQEKNFLEWCSMYDDLKHITESEDQ